jgi:phosphoglucomutase
VYTPIHGTGVKLIPMCLNKLGFNNIIHIPEQDVPDGNFPTVKSPNPEEPAALNMAIQKARETDADIVMGSDPDADRIGLAVKDTSGNWVLLNGNQAASILIYYLIRRWKETGKLQGKEYIVKTIVTSELLSDIATRSGVASFDVLTGFKWIADIIAQKEGGMTFIGGGEESYGYLCGTFVRDKDAVMSASLFAEIAAWAADQGKTLYDILLDIYLEFGLYKETGISVVKKGKSGAEEIRQMMESYRQSPPKTINQTPVVRIMDYQSLTTTDLPSGAVTRIDSPASDVLQFFTGDGSKISVRPSGTEPKIKYYIGVRAPLASREEFAQTNALLEQKIQGIVADLNPSV